MESSRIDQYRRWFEYEKDSHDKVLASLESVPIEQRDQPAFRKALELFGHIVVAREVWLFRFGALSECPSRLFPTDTSLATLGEQWRQIAREWDRYLATLTESDLSRKFDYKSFDGGQFRNIIEDILTQLFGHSLYHRGQIATLVRAAGGQPAITDFVYWSREAIGAQ